MSILTSSGLIKRNVTFDGISADVCDLSIRATKLSSELAIIFTLSTYSVPAHSRSCVMVLEWGSLQSARYDTMAYS